MDRAKERVETQLSSIPKLELEINRAVLGLATVPV
jgi:hypothetical protein